MKPVTGKSGFCATGADNPRLHSLCRARWTTPSSDVTCGCPCHQRTGTTKARTKGQVANETPKRTKGAVPQSPAPGRVKGITSRA